MCLASPFTVSLQLMTLYTMDKFWLCSEESMENLLIDLKKLQYKNLAGFSVEFTHEFLETTDKICKNGKTLSVYA